MTGRGQLHELDGERLTLREWAERYGLPKGLVAVRVSKGWDLREALTRPAAVHGGARKPSPRGPERAPSERAPKAPTVTREPEASAADQRIEAAIRALRAQVVARAT